MKGLLFLSTGDTDLVALHKAAARLPLGFGSVDARNPARLGDEDFARLATEIRAGSFWAVCLRLLGGRKAMADAFDLLLRAAADSATPFLAWPGERGKDFELEASSTCAPALLAVGAEYLDQGGITNVEGLLRSLSDRLRATELGAEPPCAVPQHGIHVTGRPEALTLAEWQRLRRPGRPVVAIAFYRAHWMSGNLDFVDELCQAVDHAGGEPLAFFCYSLRDPGPEGLPAAVAGCLLEGARVIPDCLVMTLSFAVAKVQVDGGTVADDWTARWLEGLGVPVLQAITCMSDRATWQASSAGLAPLDVAMQVALPEFDGRIIASPFCFKEEVDGAPRYVPDPERCAAVARLAVAHARLRHKPNAHKKIAIVLSSYPTKNARVGNAVGLDTPASAVALLRRLRDEGYEVGELPADGDQLIQDLIEKGAYDRDYLTPAQMRQAPAGQLSAQYRESFASLPSCIREAVTQRWDQPPGRLYVNEGRLYFAGLTFGNVLLTIQPPRGFGDNPVAIYHDPALAPTHHYVAFYRWLEQDFEADAIVHLGKHGTLEWLPGKAVGLSRECMPEALLGAVPLIYPFVVNDPGEGVQAKRRGHAVIIDHLIPPMTRADSYGPTAQLEQLMDEYYQLQTLDPSKLPRIQDQIWTLVQESNLDKDLGEEERPQDFDGFVLHMDGYLCELKDAQIRGGLHVLGSAPGGEQLVDLLVELSRRSNEGVAGLRAVLETGESRAELDAAHARAQELVRLALSRGVAVAVQDGGAALEPSLRYVAESLAPRLARTTEELDNLIGALAGEFVPAGPSGAPTRGMAHVLPTGRNFYSVDPKSLPSPIAYEVGGELARALLERYLADEGAYPETVGIVVWGTAAMRTHGDDVAEVLHLLGVRPTWDGENRRVSGLEVIPLEALGRPRIDVTLRISGFFRDAFANLVHLVDRAFEIVAALEESDEDNYIAKHVRAERERKVRSGIAPEAAQKTSLYRIFGSQPGSYGAGILPLIDAGNWREVGDLARAYEAWGAFAYGRTEYGVDAVPEFQSRFASIAVAVKNQDNREHDILDSDDYLQYHGGMIATVRALSGHSPRQYHGDSADPSRVRVRDLREEVRRVFRTRAVNPKWVEGMMRHGYKGGFEMAATADYLFGYDATADVAEDWMYEGIARSYALEPTVQAFLREKNPWALAGIIRRLFEAADRGMWEHPPDDVMEQLRGLNWELDAYLEEWRDARTATRVTAGVS
ncbi:MAG: cobaltochelatase subunit CobN [Candidatus Dormibacteria bacterium]